MKTGLTLASKIASSISCALFWVKWCWLGMWGIGVRPEFYLRVAIPSEGVRVAFSSELQKATFLKIPEICFHLHHFLHELLTTLITDLSSVDFAEIRTPQSYSRQRVSSHL